MSVDATTPLGEVERLIAYLRKEKNEAEERLLEIENLACELFNPPDDDSTCIEGILEGAAKFIETVSCSCTPEMIEDFDSCARCRALGKRGDVLVSR